MPAQKIVLNASPLILLCNGRLEFVLPAIFSEIVVPTAVWREITGGPAVDRAVELLPQLDWIRRERVEPQLSVIQWDLGIGETEVLSFALQNPTYTPALDDMLAKKCARSLAIPTIGTGSILILAKEQGLINSVEDCLRRLQRIGLWVSEPVIQMIKKQAGE
jgi:predicted nucleic acid-binding protein